MLVPVFQPRTPPRRRVRADEQSTSPPPPPATVTVVAVTWVGSFLADWEFSGPITLTGSAAPELEIDGENLGFIGPDFVDQIGPATLRGDYSTASGIVPGDAWRVLAPPAGISPAVSTPASGNVV